MFKVLSSLQGDFLMFNQSEMKLIEYPSLSLSESYKPFIINLCWCFYSIWFDYSVCWCPVNMASLQFVSDQRWTLE